MKKLIAVIAAILSSLLIFAAFSAPAYQGKDRGLYTAAVFSVVGWREMGATTERLEEDDYGRILFEYSVLNDAFFSDAEKACVIAYVIVQKMSNELVWFYEDDCCEVFRSRSDISEDRIEQLKLRNHWNEEPADEGLVSRKIWSGGARFADYDESVLKDPLERPTTLFYDVWDTIREVFHLDCESAAGELFNVDSTGKRIYYFRACDNDGSKGLNGCYSTHTYTGTYFLAVGADGKIDDTCKLVQVEDAYNYREVLKQLKVDILWSGYCAEE